MGSIFNEDSIKEIERRSAGIDMILDFIGGSKDGPIDFRVLKADRDFNKAVRDMMLKKGFLKLDDEVKLALMNFYEQGIELVKDMNAKIEEKEN